MAGYCSPVRLLLWLILAFLVLFAFAAPGTEWIGWLLGIIVLVVLLMIEAMFSDPNDFVFDPSVSASVAFPFITSFSNDHTHPSLSERLTHTSD